MSASMKDRRDLLERIAAAGGWVEGRALIDAAPGRVERRRTQTDIRWLERQGYLERRRKPGRWRHACTGQPNGGTDRQLAEYRAVAPWPAEAAA